ncbi:hypothetical protein [Marinimicrobium sp.]
MAAAKLNIFQWHLTDDIALDLRQQPRAFVTLQ